ncbi:MAG: DNA repair protein RadA, partial [Alistipes sp.]|nr:DNA repair protein RadA [Alistipes sp.]
MKQPKKVYVCSECDYQSAKWMGRCPSCNAWNSFTEETYTQIPEPPSKAADVRRRTMTPDGEREKAMRFRDITTPDY